MSHDLHDVAVHFTVQEGTPIATLGAELYAMTIAAASGSLTVGERARHSQVAIWRNWPQVGPCDLSAIVHGPLSGAAFTVPPQPSLPIAAESVSFAGFPGAGRGGRPVAARVGLVLPTSLCRCVQGYCSVRAALCTSMRFVILCVLLRNQRVPHTQGEMGVLYTITLLAFMSLHHAYQSVHRPHPIIV